MESCRELAFRAVVSETADERCSPATLAAWAAATVRSSDAMELVRWQSRYSEYMRRWRCSDCCSNNYRSGNSTTRCLLRWSLVDTRWCISSDSLWSCRPTDHRSTQQQRRRRRLQRLWSHQRCIDVERFGYGRCSCVDFTRCEQQQRSTEFPGLRRRQS